MNETTLFLNHQNYSLNYTNAIDLTDGSGSYTPPAEGWVAPSSGVIFLRSAFASNHGTLQSYINGNVVFLIGSSNTFGDISIPVNTGDIVQFKNSGTNSSDFGNCSFWNFTFVPYYHNVRNSSTDNDFVGISGATNYRLEGVINQLNVNIMFDIQTYNNTPITYKLIDGSFVEGLVFDPVNGTVTGTPTKAADTYCIVLASANGYELQIRIEQYFKEESEVIPPSEQISELTNIVTKLRSGDLSGLTEGMILTIPLADDTEDIARAITYNGSEYIRYTANDGGGLYAWVNADGVIYTDEIALLAGDDVKDSQGSVKGVLDETPTYMKDYQIMLTSIDTDVPADETYAHNLRFEFLNSVYEISGDDDTIDDHKAIYRTSKVRTYLTSDAPDGFMVRLPRIIRDLIVPVNIESYECDWIVPEDVILTDRVFIPSAFEYCGTTSLRVFPDSDSSMATREMVAEEGVKSTYYPETIDATAKRCRYRDDGRGVAYATRTLGGNGLLSRLRDAVTIDNYGCVVSKSYYTDGTYWMIRVFPAFVIA